MVSGSGFRDVRSLGRVYQARQIQGERANRRHGQRLVCSRIERSEAHGQSTEHRDYGRLQVVELGKLELKNAGNASLAVKAMPEGWQPFNLRSIKLTLL